MNHLIAQTSSFLQQRTQGFEPEFGIILGTGLGNLIEEIDVQHSISYANIPNFPISTVEFHRGKLIFGTLSGRRVVAMQGRFHYYEGYTMQQITFPVRVMKAMGIQKLFVSNASGSLNPSIRKGDLAILIDHIDLLPENPLRGINDNSLGPRFPDMSQPYDRTMSRQALDIARKHDYSVHEAVYVGTSGPNLETKAEYRYMRLIGGDVVGMSTVPEVIVANHASLPVFAISVVTDEGFHENLQPVSLEDIVAVAATSEPKMTQILKELIALQ